MLGEQRGIMSLLLNSVIKNYGIEVLPTSPNAEVVLVLDVRWVVRNREDKKAPREGVGRWVSVGL